MKKEKGTFEGKVCYHCGDKLTRDHNVFVDGHWFCGGVCAEIEEEWEEQRKAKLRGG